MVFFGDTRQLPPTVVSGDRELRRCARPLADGAPRAERCWAGRRSTCSTACLALVEFPSKHFYKAWYKAPTAFCERGPARFRSGPWGACHLLFWTLTEDETKHEAGFSNAARPRLAVDVVSEFLRKEEKNVVVLSPYAKQVSKVRTALRRAGVEGVRVGSVDSFQGQEADIVVFSATRSNQEGSLGFVRDARRLNVALTRAKRGLVVVGDAVTLSNSHRSALIAGCRRR